MGKRRFLAAVLAPLVGAIVACLGLVTTAAVVLDREPAAPSWPAVFEHWLGFYLLLGLPLAYGAEALAIAIYHENDPAGQPRLLVATTVGGSVGGVLVFAVWAALFGLTFGLMMLPSGLAGGAVAGIVYWVAGVRASRSTSVV